MVRVIPPRPGRGRWAGIALDRTPVAVVGRPLDVVYWRGREWAVTRYGVERLDGTYAVSYEQLGDDPHDDIPTDIAATPGAPVDEFVTAWLLSLLLHTMSPETRKDVFDLVAAMPDDRLRGGIARKPA